MKVFDIAIIGLGAMGSATLYQLSKLGLNVVGIDQYKPPHTHGSSHGESRVTRQAIGEGVIYTPLVLRANEIWQELEKLSRETLYEHCGMLLAAYEDQPFLQNTIKAAKDFSIQHEILSDKEVEQRFPAIKATNKEHVFYFEPTAGYLKPEKCIEVQLKLARDNGAKTLLNTTVKAFSETDQGVKITLDNSGTIIANRVIVTTGPWIQEMLPTHLRSLFTTYLQTQYWFEIDSTHYGALQPGTMPLFLCADEHTVNTRSFYGFPALNGAEGGMKFAVHETTVIAKPEEKDTLQPVTSSETIYSLISKYIRYVKPETLRTVNCLYTMTPDENFILDFLPGSDHIVIASACSGHGFKHSAAVGEMLARLATKGKSELDISEFRLSRFKKRGYS